MGDLSDVENALASFIAGVVYPSGTSQPSAIGAPCRIFRGWPDPARLDADLTGKALDAQGALRDTGLGPIVSISIYPQPNMERVTNRYPRIWKTVVPPAPTITATGSDDHTVIIGGTIAVPQTIHVVTRGQVFAYPLQPSDTLATIASGLATLINAQTPATSSGPTITLAQGFATSARVSSPGQALKEIGRQQRSILISIWAPNPTLRDAAAKLIDPALRLPEFIALADGSFAWLIYRGSNPDDGQQIKALYRRDLMFWAEYATTVGETEFAIATIQENVASGQQPDIATPVQQNFGD